MKQRCQNKRCKAYHNYGERGITVCDEWQKFEPFCAWALDNGYRKGLDLDRKNNDGNYTPENCRWITRRDNINNRRASVFINVNGVNRTIAEWEREANITTGAINYWIKSHGKDYAARRIEEAIANGYKENDFSRNHVMRPVRCIETQEEFFSIKEAGRKMNLNSGNISKTAKTGTKTCGYSFEYI